MPIPVVGRILVGWHEVVRKVRKPVPPFFLIRMELQIEVGVLRRGAGQVHVPGGVRVEVGVGISSRNE